MIYLSTPITQHPYTDWVISHDEGIVETILTRKNQQQSIIYFGGNAVQDDAQNQPGARAARPHPEAHRVLRQAQHTTCRGVVNI